MSIIPGMFFDGARLDTLSEAAGVEYTFDQWPLKSLSTAGWRATSIGC